MSHENLSFTERRELFESLRPKSVSEFYALSAHWADTLVAPEDTPEARNFLSRLIESGQGTLSLEDINFGLRDASSGAAEVEAVGIEESIASVPFAPPEGEELTGEDATTEAIAENRASLALVDPEIADVPDNVVVMISRIQAANGSEFTGYDPDTGVISFATANGDIFQISVDGSVVSGARGIDSSFDGARDSLLAAQTDQIRAMLDPRLIDLGDGRAVLRGTDQIIDTRTPNFSPIEGTEGAFFDPVTGQIFNDAGNVLAKDQFEFQQQVTIQQQQVQAADFEEQQRQAARGLAAEVGLAGDTTRRLAQTSASQTGLGLEGLLSEQAIAGREIPLAGLQTAGSLSATLQQLLDQRGRDIIGLSADPGDFVEREFAVRGLQPPEGTEVPLFQDPSQLSGIIDQLANFAGPEFRDPAALEAMISELFNTQPTTLAQILQSAGQVPTTPAPAPVAPPPIAPPPSAPAVDPIQAAIDQFLLDAKTATSQIGAPSGNVFPTGVTTTSGTGGTTTGVTSNPPLTQISGLVGDEEALEHGGTTKDKKFIVGDSTTGKPNPELVEVTPQGTKVTPLSQFQFGTDSISSSGVDPSGTFTTSVPQHTDSTIQNLPFLQFLKGTTTPQEFGTLSTGTATGAFGTQLPEAGRVNFNRLSQLIQDPTAASMLDSLLRSGSRSLSGLFNLVKQRAPLGSALSTSSIRT